MKKIAIVTRKMITGGVEKALLSLLNELRNYDLEIDLYLESLGGELYKDVPNWVNIKEIPKKSNLYKIFKNPKKSLNLFISKLKIRNESDYIKQCELTSHCLPLVEKKYDVAISYHAPNTVPVFYTINNINANKKILWLHGDIITNNATGDMMFEYYKQYDKIFAVSKYIKETFNQYFPSLSHKVDVFYNFVDEQNLIELSMKGSTFDKCEKVKNILTIGRLDYQKGYDLAIEVCKKLKDDNLNIKWYVCGEGNSRNEIEELIDKYNLKEEFILLGNQENPYGYLKDCYLYVQTSRFEGYCTTTNEARVFGKAVVTTNVSGADEQFEDNKTGLIADIDVESIYYKVKLLIENPSQKEYIESNLKKSFKKETESIEKLTNLF